MFFNSTFLLSFCSQGIHFFFVLTFWSFRKTPWLERYKFNFKIYDVQPEKQTSETHILANISRSKDIQKIKFGQLLEYNMRNNITLYIKSGGGTVPRPFLKSQNLACLWISSLNIYTVFVFIVCQVVDYWNILALSCRPLVFTSYKAFQIHKKGIELFLNYSWTILIFCMTFEEKHFSCYILLTEKIPLSGYLYFGRYWAIGVFYLLVNHVFPHDPKVNIKM